VTFVTPSQLNTTKKMKIKAEAPAELQIAQEVDSLMIQGEKTPLTTKQEYDGVSGKEGPSSYPCGW
jgi:hypothetical protein